MEQEARAVSISSAREGGGHVLDEKDLKAGHGG